MSDFFINLVNFQNFSVRVEKAMTRMRARAGPHRPSLATYSILYQNAYEKKMKIQSNLWI